MTPGKARCDRSLGQAQVALDLGKSAQDRLQALALAPLVLAEPVHRRGQPAPGRLPPWLFGLVIVGNLD
jgi:hypothetical protein